MECVLLFMFGMLIWVCLLYLGMKFKNGKDFEWDVVDCDLDIVIYEFLLG